MSQDIATMAVNGSSLPVSVKDRQRWTPDHYVKDGTPREGAAVYILRALSTRDRRMVRRATKALCGLPIELDELRTAYRAAAIAALEPESAAAAIRTLDEMADYEKALADQKEEDRDPLAVARHVELQGEVNRWQARISRKSQELRDLLAEQEAWIETYCDVTVRACVLDWEGLPAPCVRANALVTEAAMLAVPDEDRDALIAQCIALRELTSDQEPDSVSP